MNVLLTAFRNTSAEELLADVKEFPVLLLPNDKVKDTEILMETLLTGNYDYVICLGQRPNIKDQVHIETTARQGELVTRTDADCNGLLQAFGRQGIQGKLSQNAGSSYCNQLFWGGLKGIERYTLNTKLWFVHIPYRKNIRNLDGFQRAFVNAIKQIEGITHE